MSRLRAWLFRLCSPFRRKGLEEGLSEEIRLHLEMQAEANVAAGMAPEEARSAALRAFGGVDQVKENCRDERGIRWIDECGRDLRHSTRSLAREKSFSATILATFALCVAANVAIFTLVHEILIRPLPFPDPDGILTVYDSYPKAGVAGGVSVPHFLERKEQVGAFAQAAATREGTVVLEGQGFSETVEVIQVTSQFFPILHVTAALGRVFTAEEDTLGHDQVALISDETWRGRFGSDPSVIGRTVHIDTFPYTVIGVLPRGFHYLSKHPSVWVPLAFTPYERLDGMRHANGLNMLVRLRDGVSRAQAQDQLDALNTRTLKRDPFAATAVQVGFCSVIRRLHADHVSAIRATLLLIQAGAFFLLIIGALNIANLLLVRATANAKEYSVRRALGAGSFRIGRMLVLETLMLSTAGGFLGLLLGNAVLRLTLSRFSDRLPLEVSTGLNAAVCLVTLAVCALCGLVLAGPAVWHCTRGDLAATLSSETRGGTTSRAVHRFRHALIVAQIALAFALLSSAGLLAYSLRQVLMVDPGFRQENLLTASIGLPKTHYAEDKQCLAFVVKLMRELKGSPGVLSYGIDAGLPFTGGGPGICVQFKSHALDPGEAGRPHPVCSVAGDLFAALGVSLVQGRLIDEGDVEAGRMVCVVDSDFARRYWPRGDAIGHGITPDMDSKAKFFTIVGIVRPVKQNELTDQLANGAVYIPYGSPLNANPWFMVALRTGEDPQIAAATLRAAVSRVDPDVRAGDVRPMDSRISESTRGRRISLSLAAGFAGIALALSAVGIYGVLAYSVAQRRREIGVRLALGARPGQILLQFLLLGLRLLAIGLPVGFAGAFLSARLMAGFLFGVSPGNALVLGGTTLLLGLAAMLACLAPARRAASVSPSEALRE